MSAGSASAPSPWAANSARLMVAAVIGAHVALLIAVAAAGLLAGADAAVSTLLAGLSVAILWTLGQQLQVVMVQRADLSAMAVTLAGFALRVLILGGALAFWLANAHRFPGLIDWALALGCIAVSIGWLVGMLVRYSRLRIPIYDRGYSPPSPGPTQD